MFPQVFSVGGFYLPTYGLLVAIAFLTAVSVTGRLARRSGLDKDAVLNLAIYCALAGIVGAKLLMFLVDFRYYADRPDELLSFSSIQAGGIFYGGLIGALLTAWIYSGRVGLPPLQTADAFAPGLAIGHAIGRLGCFSAGCCWGIECHRPWAVTFTNSKAITGVPLNTPLHPTQLYEAASEALIFAVLYVFFGRPHKPGAVIGLYVLLYGSVRFVVDFFRYHDPGAPPGGLYAAQWISLMLIACSIAGHFWSRHKKNA